MRYWLTTFLTRALLFPYWPPEVLGRKNLPAGGPLIVAGNHPTLLDGFVIAALMPRRLDFLVMHPVLNLPLVGPWLRSLDVIPADRAHLPEALARLRRGGWIGIFPEGQHTHSQELWEFRPGVAVLARRSGAPVVPVGCLGSQRLLPERAAWLKGGPIRLAIGPPLSCGADESVEAFLARVRQAVQAQLESGPPPPGRRGLGFRLAQLFWVPFSWLVFQCADLARPGGRR